MIRFIFLTTLALAIALVGGIGSVWLALQSGERFNAIVVDNWTVRPDRGTPASNPYSRAIFVRQPQLPLGSSEGIVFDTRHDSAGDVLDAGCDYRLSGNFPSARFWTLHARRLDGSLAQTAMSGRRPALHSRALLRNEDGELVVSIAARPTPGNWLAIGGSGPFELVLIFYDTAIISTASVSDLEMPVLERMACHG